MGNSWWSLVYSTIINTISLSLCMVGAKLFGHTSCLTLAVVLLASVTSFVSFFQDSVMVEHFTHNLTGSALCRGDTMPDNCTVSVDGRFVGILTQEEGFFNQNMFMEFKQDCSDPTMKVTFFTVFGVLFSSVTGIMAGANMSGDLKNPGKSIARGTLAALAFTFCWFQLLSHPHCSDV